MTVSRNSAQTISIWIAKTETTRGACERDRTYELELLNLMRFSAVFRREATKGTGHQGLLNLFEVLR